MTAGLSVLKALGLVLAGVVGGAALLMLAVWWLASLSGDDSATGCAGIGGALLIAAIYLMARVLLA